MALRLWWDNILSQFINIMFLGKKLKSPLKNASTYDGDRKYLRWPSKVLALALASTFIFLPTFVHDNDRIDDDVRMKCDVEKSHTYMKRKKIDNLSIINLLVPRPGIFLNQLFLALISLETTWFSWSIVVFNIHPSFYSMRQSLNVCSFTTLTA